MPTPRPTAPTLPGHHRGRASAVRRLAALGLVGLVGLATTGAAVAFVRLSARGHLYDEQHVPPAPVALVLGALVLGDGTPSPFLAGRLDVARRLFEAGTVEVVLVSGDSLAPEHDEPDAMRRYLVQAGVPADRVVTDHAGYDTYDSCVRARRVFGVTRLVVVTQDYHLPRAVGTARRVGLDAAGVGDTTARRLTAAWRRGAVREQLACVKTVVDLLTHRRPVLGPREDGVDRALGRAPGSRR